jgi:hypothetical protein
MISIVPDRPEPLTLAELLDWHEAHGTELAASTQASYAVVWDKWIGPRLDGKLVSDVTPAEVARFRASIERDGAGPPTVLRALAVLGSVLSEARSARPPPRVPRGRSAARSRVDVARCAPPTPERVEIIRAGLDSDVEQTPSRCWLATSGCVRRRRPPRCGATSRPTSSRRRGENGPTRVGPLLPVMRQELAALQLHKGRPGPAAPIISTDAGERWSYSPFRSFRRHRWSKVTPGMRPYDLRHAYVSLLVQPGHTVVELAKWAGHSPQVSLGTYAHLFDTVSERIDPEQAIRDARYRYGCGRATGRPLMATCIACGPDRTGTIVARGPRFAERSVVQVV